MTSAELRIFEPPRFFEAFLRGRAFTRGARHHRAHLRHLPGRLPDERGPRDGGRARRHGRRASSARCAGCSIAASGSRATRCTSTCCTRPDFLGYEGAIEMAARPCRRGPARPRAEEGRQRPDDACSAAARSTRSTCASAASTRRRASASSMRAGRAAEAGARHRRSRPCAGRRSFDFPDCTRDYEFVSLRHPDEYPLNEGRIVSNRGLDIAARDYDAHFEEIHVAHSTALQSRMRGRRHLPRRPARPLQPQLRPPVAARPARRRARPASGRSCPNPYQSIIVRAVEVLYACDEALRIIDGYERARPAVGSGRAARGRRLRRDRGAARAALSSLPPRRRRHDPRGRRSSRRPRRTRRRIEEDLTVFINGWLDLPDDALAPPLRADGPQLRSVHLLRDPLPRSAHRPRLTAMAPPATASSSASAIPIAATTRSAGWSLARLRGRLPAGVDGSSSTTARRPTLLDRLDGARRRHPRRCRALRRALPARSIRFDAAAAPLPRDSSACRPTASASPRRSNSPACSAACRRAASSTRSRRGRSTSARRCRPGRRRDRRGRDPRPRRNCLNRILTDARARPDRHA